MLSNLYIYLDDLFQATTTSQQEGATDISIQDLLSKFREAFLQNARTDEIMSALRMISSEKFRLVLSIGGAVGNIKDE